MNVLKFILLFIFFFGAMVNFYDAGKYSAGHEEVRCGTEWVIISLISGVIEIALFFAILFYM